MYKYKPNTQEKNVYKRKCNIGDIFEVNHGYKVKIVDIFKSPYVRIKFLDANGFEVDTQMTHLKLGNITNPFHRTLFNTGYLGDYDKKHKNNSKSVAVWEGMMVRSYSSAYLKNQPTYKNVTVCEEWHSYANFQKWFNENYINNFHLDKDLLQIGVENKVYSPSTCLFLPRKINNFIINKNTNNTSGFRGINSSKYNTWRAECSDFTTGKNKYLGAFKNIDDAVSCYINYKKQQIQKAKEYMINLGFWDINIINKLDNILL